ncbi:hypothetical protein Pcinc_006107 [Petrolisthes cinctipes]|uniref:Uncharacterized protein n=1 Tax=Petrolisthes cinctipes TaxID=88211 RepID=A0AAE1GDN0_PETCI|nr:hypothetical protein Pcinc_006107 [Petrolisthes cinctipes]
MAPAVLKQAVIRALLTEIFASVTPSLPTLSPGARYGGLKAVITAAHENTTIQNIKELENVQLDGRRPSALLRHMQRLNQAAVKPLPDSILKTRHTKLMLPQFQLHLITH